MPEAIAVAAVEALYAEGFIALTAAEIASAAAVVQQVAFVAASLSYSSYSQAQAKRKARNAYNASLQDREVMLATATAPRRVVYGRDKVSGPIVYWESTGATKEYLHLVVPLAAHECDAIETIYFNEVALPAADGAGDITSGEFAHTTYPIATENLAVDGSGNATLLRAGEKLVNAYTGSGAEVQYVGGSLTPGASVVTGLPPGAVVTVEYTYAQVTPCVRITKHLGQAGQVADAALVAASAGGWTSAHVGKGICYLYVRLKYDVEVFGQVGVPNISAIIRGKKVYDPRSGTTAWSENAALIAADRLRDAEFGLGAASTEVPDAELTTAANVCDELVALDALGATQPRYTFNGSFTTDVPPQDSLGDLAAAMAGNIVWSQGRWLVRPGIYRTPAPSIGPDDLARDTISITPKASRSSLFNAVRVLHRDPAQAWAEVQAPLVQNATYQAQDGGVQLVQELRLPMACDTLRAQRLGKVLLERSRQAMGVAITTNLRAYDLAPTDTVPLALERYGWGAGKVFEVEERTWAGGLEINYLLRETAAGIYAWNYGEATLVDLAPDTSLPSPYTTPAAPTGLAVASGPSHTITLSDGTVLSRAYTTWAASTERFVLDGGRVEVEWRQAGAADWQPAEPLPGTATAVYISPVPDGRLIAVRVRFINASGRSSAWEYVAHTVEVRPANQPLALFSWVPGTTGTQGVAPYRHNAIGNAGEDSIVLAAGPDGQLAPLWRAYSTDGTATPDGGWDTDRFAIDHLQQYRVLQWIKCTGTMDGATYLGVEGNTVRAIGGAPDPAPYFAIISRSTLTSGRWYLLVGYVLPSTYAGVQQNMGGIWDGVTGQKLGGGVDFQWVASQPTTLQRSYLYYANAGAEQHFTAPVVQLCDGTEPAIPQILAGAAAAQAAAAIAVAAAAQVTADAASLAVADMAADGVLTPVEKPNLILQNTVLTTEQAGIDAQATAYGITTEKTAYDAAVAALAAHMATLTTPVAWNDLAGNTTVDGPLLRSKFSAVSGTKQTLLNAIAAVAGTQANWALLAGKPGDTDLLNTHTQGGVLVVNHPAGGNAGFNGGPTTGAIKIKLPQSWTNTMMRLFVEIYEYDADKSLTLEVGGYNYSGGGGAWYNVYAKMTGSSTSEKAVRFGHDGATCCIWIGEPGSVWQYPQVVVSNLRAGYSNNTSALWASGWAVSVDNTAHTGHAITGTIANPLTGANFATSTGQIETIQLGAGASTLVYQTTVSASQSVSAAIDQGHATYAIPLPGVDCSITITASMNLSATGGSIRGCSVVAAIRVSDTGTNANRDVGAQLRGPIAGVSQSVDGSLTVTRTIAYTTSQGARTAWLDCQMQGVTPSGGANCWVQDIHMRVEVIKR